jgi:protein-S-isoprenylcysteine O-methyltransferase Ste14
MPDLITAAALAACWGTVIAVWCAGAAFSSIRGPRGRIRDRTGDRVQLGAAALSAAVLLASRGYWSTWAFDVPWVHGLGLVLLVVSTVFALWARLELGTDWSLAPEVEGGRRLHTSGPYEVTRHPIYSGLLGMILGTAVLTGSGQMIVLVPVALVLFSIKIHFEERRLTATFPDEYTEYRHRVPQLVPRLAVPRRRD